MLSLHLALDHLIISNSFTYPKLSQMFQKNLSFFFRKHVVSDFWGVRAILKLLYRCFHAELDPTDLGLVFASLKHVAFRNM